MSKVCFKCHTEKPLTEFYKHSGMSDGFLGKCKSCTKVDSTLNRNANIGKYQEYDRVRGNRQSPEYLKEYRERHPLKYAAHNLVNNGVRDGKITKSPCEVCGEAKSVAHHDDYAEPLNVRWLCQAHHKQWHSEHGEGLNGG